MNYSEYICFDFETGGKDPNTVEAIQVAAVHIHPRRLILGDSFNSLMRPLEPDKLEEEALRINKKTREELAAAPHPKDVWQQFTTFVKKFNYKGTPFGAPIACGYNITNFDMVLVERMCQLYGPINEKTGKQALFSSFIQYDVMLDIFRFWENRRDLPNMRLTTVLEYMGMSSEGAHDAMWDTRATAQLVCKYLKLYRHLGAKVSFKDCFKNAELAAV